MNIVPVIITGRGGALTDDRTWARSRVEVAAREAVSRGIAAGAPANIVGVIVVALWANETAWGRKERRYNVGSVHCTPAFDGDCMRVGSEVLRAYPSIEVAVREWFGLIQSQYSPAWEHLQVGDLSYWSVLQQLEYGGHVTGREALSIARRVSGFAGFAGMTAAEESELLASWSESAWSSSSGVSPLVVGGGLLVLSKLAGWW